MDDKRKCEKCNKAQATIECTRDGGNMKWWYCEKCFPIIMSEHSLENIKRDWRGFPTPPPTPGIGFIVWQDGTTTPFPPRGPRGDPKNMERTMLLIKAAMKGGRLV